MKKFKLQRKEDVWQAIRRRGKELASKLKDKEIFLSPEFKSYATRLADFILRKHKLYNLTIEYQTDPSAPIAYTDGKKICLNVGNSIAASPKLLERRFKVNMGILFHECGHKMFMDFDVHHRIMDTLSAGTLFGAFPDPLPPDYVTALDEMRDVIASPYCPALVSLFHHISNCVNDGHDETAMKRCFPGFIADCITAAGEVQLENAPTLARLVDDRRSNPEILTSLILQYAKFSSYKTDGGTPEEEDWLEQMSEIEPVIDAALLEDDYAARWDHINHIMLFLWPFVRDQFPKNPNNQSSDASQGAAGGNASGSGGGNGSGQSSGDSSSGGQQGAQGQGSDGSSNPAAAAGSGSSGSSTATPEEVQAAMDSLIQKVAQETNVAPAPVNGTGGAVSPDQLASATVPSSNTNGLDQIVKSISEEKAAKQVQSELDKAQMDAIRNTDLPLIHKNVPCCIIRHNKQDEAKYRAISDEIAPVVRSLSKRMLDLFRELNEERVQHHRRWGPIVEPTEAYRLDKTFFAKKKLPEDHPDMALCVLIDQSGSMYGHKLETAIKTAILLEQFADNVGIPLMVAGHSVEGDGVHLRIFTDYVSARTQQDKYSLAGIEDGGCNRDGLPIRLCCELLEQRTEKVRLMVIISDGSPNDGGYRGKEARQDISETVEKFRRKGLIIYGAAIDDDRDIIQEIYGKNFLSIDELDQLPKTLVRLVRQYII